jgi:hypothetical protein
MLFILTLRPYRLLSVALRVWQTGKPSALPIKKLPRCEAATIFGGGA